MSEAEVIENIIAVLEKVRQGAEVIIEQDHRPIAVISPKKPAGRPISEVIAALEASGANAVLDEDYARDVEEGTKAYSQPWIPPSWD